MPRVEILVGWNWGVQPQIAIDPETGERNESGRMLFFNDPVTHTQIQVPLDLPVADDMGGQLQGQPPKKHIELPQGMIPNAVLRNGGGPAGRMN